MLNESKCQNTKETLHDGERGLTMGRRTLGEITNTSPCSPRASTSIKVEVSSSKRIPQESDKGRNAPRRPFDGTAASTSSYIYFKNGHNFESRQCELCTVRATYGLPGKKATRCREHGPKAEPRAGYIRYVSNTDAMSAMTTTSEYAVESSAPSNVEISTTNIQSNPTLIVVIAELEKFQQLLADAMESGDIDAAHTIASQVVHLHENKVDGAYHFEPTLQELSESAKECLAEFKRTDESNGYAFSLSGFEPDAWGRRDNALNQIYLSTFDMDSFNLSGAVADAVRQIKLHNDLAPVEKRIFISQKLYCGGAHMFVGSATRMRWHNDSSNSESIALFSLGGINELRIQPEHVLARRTFDMVIMNRQMRSTGPKHSVNGSKDGCASVLSYLRATDESAELKANHIYAAYVSLYTIRNALQMDRSGLKPPLVNIEELGINSSSTRVALLHRVESDNLEGARTNASIAQTRKGAALSRYLELRDVTRKQLNKYIALQGDKFCETLDSEVKCSAPANKLTLEKKREAMKMALREVHSRSREDEYEPLRCYYKTLGVQNKCWAGFKEELRERVDELVEYESHDYAQRYIERYPTQGDIWKRDHRDDCRQFLITKRGREPSDAEIDGELHRRWSKGLVTTRDKF